VLIQIRLAVAIRTAAAAFIRAAIVAPDRVTQVQVAGIGGRADGAAGDRAGKRADGGTTRSTDGGAAGKAITCGGTATGWPMRPGLSGKKPPN
jgi:ribosomal protein S6E (S10)